METLVDQCLLNVKVEKLEDGSFHFEMHANGKVIETNLGDDEQVAQGKFHTLVNGLNTALDTVINGLIDAYGKAEDEVED